MAASEYRLALERPIHELEARKEKLERIQRPSPEVREEIRRLRRELTELTRQIYENLKPWQTVEVARHPDRPMTTDYLDLTFDEFVELHGDKFFGDDRAIRTGWAKLDTFKVLVVGHQKGKTLKERTACNYGFAHPDVNAINHYWSVGAQYQGLIPSRDKDVLAFGVAQSIMSHTYRNNVNPLADRETVYELYYAIVVTPWLVITPDVQVITNPGGNEDAHDALVGGVRVKIAF